EALLRRAADRGYAPAHFQLGHFYSEDYGDGPNFAEVERCYRAAAEAGHLASQLVLARNYLSGSWGRRDDVEAAGSFRRAAEAARRWFEQAASQGHAAAQPRLAALDRMQGRQPANEPGTRLVGSGS